MYLRDLSHQEVGQTLAATIIHRNPKKMGFWTRLLAFEEQLTFYAQYHHNGVNKAIHMVFVPVILATASLFLANYSLEGYFQQSPEMRDFVIEVLGDRALQFLASLTVAHLVAFGYGTYYILLEPFAGVLPPTHPPG